MTTSSAPVPAPPSEELPAARFRWRMVVLAALFIGLLLPRLSSGTLYQHDEIYTANRAREILVRGDPWAITRNFEPDFRKPPLQYWLCALTLRLLPAYPELAVRLPAMLYGAACLLALAFLARCGYGDEGVETGLAAALALAGCSFFVYSSRVGLLDTGAALHLTLAVTGCQLARRDPRWWWFVGLQGVLGAWQKAPFVFAAWTIILAVRRFGGGPSVRRLSWRPHLLAAFTISLLIASSWWALQALRFGPGAVLAAGAWQTRALTVAHDPGDAGFRPWLYWFWLARDWALPGLCAPVMVVGALRRRWQPNDDQVDTTPTREIAWICAVFAAGLVLIPYRAERYLVVFAPLLALLIVRWLRDISSRLQNTVARRWLLPLALLSTLPAALFFHYLNSKPVKADLLAASHDFGRQLRPDETPVLDADADPDFEVAGFVEFYAGLRRPLRTLAPSDIHALPSPVRGICRVRQWPQLAHADPTARRIATHGDWIVWAR